MVVLTGVYTKMTKGGQTLGGERGKHRPQQLPISKTPVSVLRKVVTPSRPKSLDPRFDRAFGHYNPDLCSQSYLFVNDIQRDERRQLKEAMIKEMDSNKKLAMQRLLDRHASVEATQRKDAEKKAVLKEWKEQEGRKVAQGKQPYHLKKKEVEAMVLEKKLEDLKAKGVNLEKVVERKRKKRATKQHKRLPFKTPDQLQE